MAASAAVIYYVLTGGNDLNGGGFDSSVTSPGTDYSQNTTPQVTFNGTTVTAADAGIGATITLTGYTVATTDNGNSLNIASGTLFTAGVYTIISVNVGANTWTLDRNCTTGAGAAMVGRMGGGWATPKGAPFVSATLWLVPGCTIMIQGAGTNNPSTVDYVTTGFVAPPSGNATVGRITLQGYNGRPHISTDGLLYNTAGIWKFSKLKISMTGTSNNSANGVVGNGGNCILDDIYLDQKNLDTKLAIGSSGTQFRNVHIYSSVAISGGAGTQAAFDLTGNYGTQAQGCVANGCKGLGFKLDGGASVKDCIAVACASTGVQSASSRSDMAIKIQNLTVDGNSGHGIEMTNDNSVSLTMIENTTVSNHVVAGKVGIYANNSRTAAVNDKIKGIIDYNNVWNNTTNYQGISAGTHDLNVDPQFTNSAGGDYSIGTNLKAMGFPGVFPPAAAIATTGYLDIGAVQRQEAGGGSTSMIMSRLQAGM